MKQESLHRTEWGSVGLDPPPRGSGGWPHFTVITGVLAIGLFLWAGLFCLSPRTLPSVGTSSDLHWSSLCSTSATSGGQAQVRQQGVTAQPGTGRAEGSRKPPGTPRQAPLLKVPPPIRTKLGQASHTWACEGQLRAKL